MDEAMKERIIQCNILPAALYGVESTKVAKTALHALRSAIADIIGPSSSKRSVNLTFDCTCCSKDLDPIAHILYLRVSALRRTIAKNPAKRSSMELIIKSYKNNMKIKIPKRPSLWDDSSHDQDEDDDSPNRGACGPVGLLMDDLHAIGLDLSDDLWISGDGEVPFNIIEMPWQHMKSAVMSISARSRMKNTNQERTFCGDVSELDNSILKTVINSLGEKEQHIYKHVATGAYWNDAELADIEVGGGMCSHCGQSVVAASHVLWDCECVNALRTIKVLSEVRSSDIPKSVANGLPPAMATNFKHPLWGKATSDEEPVSNCATLDRFNHVVHSDSKNALVKHLSMSNQSDGLEASARKCFTGLKGPSSPADMPTPVRCIHLAPLCINVFTDGSWLHPLRQFLGLGGAGVWWPDRTVEQAEISGNAYFCSLSEVEFEMAHTRQTSSGLQLFTKIGGYGGSSTRTELAGGIIAMFAEGPVHIGSDSEAFVDKATALINLISKGGDPQQHRPWSMCQDGDLWAHFCKCVLAKGPQSIRLTWVKGHAKQHHIDKGVTTLTNKTGNDKADEAADEATKLHGADLIQVAGWLHDRTMMYISFMKHVSHHIIEGYLIHRAFVCRDELKAKTAELDSDRGTSYTPLYYPAPSYGTKRRLVNIASVLNFKAFAAGSANAMQVQQFLANLDVVPVDRWTRPTTWIELFILYVARGHFPQDDASASSCDIRPTPDKLLREFKNTCRNIVQRTLDENTDGALFKPANKTRNILDGVAISGQVAGPSFSVVMDDKEKLEVAKRLINLSRKVTGKNLQSYLQRGKKFVPRILALNGNSGWVSTINSPCPPFIVNRLWAPAPLGEVVPIKPTAFYKCRLCDKVEPSTLSRFQYDDLDLKIKCIHCSSMSVVKDWTCSCSKRWYACTVHSKSLVLCEVLPQDSVQATGQGVTSSRPKRKPVAHSHEYHELLSEDLRRERKRRSVSTLPVIILDDVAGPSQTLMSNLSKRLGLQPVPIARA
jgi:ribonuclease HI